MNSIPPRPVRPAAAHSPENGRMARVLAGLPVPEEGQYLDPPLVPLRWWLARIGIPAEGDSFDSTGLAEGADDYTDNRFFVRPVNLDVSGETLDPETTSWYAAPANVTADGYPMAGGANRWYTATNRAITEWASVSEAAYIAATRGDWTSSEKVVTVFEFFDPSMSVPRLCFWEPLPDKRFLAKITGHDTVADPEGDPVHKYDWILLGETEPTLWHGGWTAAGGGAATGLGYLYNRFESLLPASAAGVDYTNSYLADDRVVEIAWNAVNSRWECEVVNCVSAP